MFPSRARDLMHLSRMRAHDLCISVGASCLKDVMGDELREENITIKWQRKRTKKKRREKCARATKHASDNRNFRINIIVVNRIIVQFLVSR